MVKFNISKNKNRRIVAFLLLFTPLLLPLINAPAALDQQIAFRTFLLGLFIAVSIVITAFVSGKKFKLNGYARVLMLLVLLFITLSGISLSYTQVFSDALFVWVKILLFSCYLFIIITFEGDVNQLIKWGTRIIVLLGMAICIISIFQLASLFTTNTAISHAMLYQVNGTFGHKNLSIEFMLLIFPFNVYVFCCDKTFWRYTAMVVAILFLTAIVLFMTRSAWVGLFAATFVTLSAGLVKHILPVRKPLRILTFGIAIVIMTAAIVSLSRYSTSSSAMIKQISKITQFNYGSVKDRLVLWKKTLNMTDESPILGKGLASWKFHILKEGNRELRSENNVIFYQRPHNDYLWILAELGIAGLVIFGGIIVLTGYVLLKLMHKITNRYHQYFALSLLFSFTGFLTISLFSFPLDRIAHSLIFILVIGFTFLLSKQYYNAPNRQVNSKLAIIGILLVSLAGGFVAFKRFQAETHLKKAYQLRQHQQWRGVIDKIAQIDQRFFEIDPYSTPVTWYAGLAHFNLHHIHKAYNCFKKAYTLNPYHIYVLNDLATTGTFMQKYTDALKYYKKAIQYAPNFNEALYNITTLYLKTGQRDSALHHFMRISPNYTESRYVQLLEALVYPKMRSIKKEVDNVDLKNTIQDMIGSHQWTKAILEKAHKNNLTLQQQIIKDAIFVLKKNNKFAKEHERLLNQQYGLKN